MSYEHQPWCAKAIAANAELPWTVRCDCKPKPKKASMSEAPERQLMFKKMQIDIVDELQAEAMYRYFDLFQRAADEIKRLRSAIEFAHSEGFEWPSDPLSRN
jgi:hypothetical protein